MDGGNGGGVVVTKLVLIDYSDWLFLLHDLVLSIEILDRLILVIVIVDINFIFWMASWFFLNLLKFGIWLSLHALIWIFLLLIIVSEFHNSWGHIRWSNGALMRYYCAINGWWINWCIPNLLCLNKVLLRH